MIFSFTEEDLLVTLNSIGISPSVALKSEVRALDKLSRCFAAALRACTVGQAVSNYGCVDRTSLRRVAVIARDHMGGVESDSARLLSDCERSQKSKGNASDCESHDDCWNEAICFKELLMIEVELLMSSKIFADFESIYIPFRLNYSYYGSEQRRNIPSKL